MDTKTLHITVESTADFFEAARADIRAVAADEATEDRYVLSLPDEAALERLVRARNLELLRTIATAEPESVRELARQVDRDVKNVSTALADLEELGLVRFEQAGRAKRPIVWYDEIDIDIPLGSASATVSAD
jgi:predicted transcriptional regulator